MKYHIVSGDSPAGSLKYYFKENNISDIIINHFDDLSVGPIHTNIEDRLTWIGDRLFPWDMGGDREEIMEYTKQMLEKYGSFISSLHSEDEVYIWYGDNIIEDMMLYRACHDVKKGQIYTIYVGRYKNSYGDFLRAVGECSPEDLGKMGDTGYKLDPTSKEAYASYYEDIVKYKGLLRIDNDGTVQVVDENYYDDEILKHTSNGDFIPAPRVIGDVMGYSDQVVSDSYLQYRLKGLIDEGKITIQGELDSLRTFKIKKI